MRTKGTPNFVSFRETFRLSAEQVKTCGTGHGFTYPLPQLPILNS
jgi:hypothetical protein